MVRDIVLLMLRAGISLEVNIGVGVAMVSRYEGVVE